MRARPHSEPDLVTVSNSFQRLCASYAGIRAPRSIAVAADYVFWVTDRSGEYGITAIDGAKPLVVERNVRPCIQAEFGQPQLAPWFCSKPMRAGRTASPLQRTLDSCPQLSRPSCAVVESFTRSSARRPSASIATIGLSICDTLSSSGDLSIWDELSFVRCSVRVDGAVSLWP